MTETPGSTTTRSPTFRTAPWYSWATAVPRALTTPLWANIYMRRLGVRRLKELSTPSWKRGGTAFIMGSGPSINELTEQQWDVIRSGTTIGVNWWTKHEFVPDLYVFENLSQRHRQSLIERSDDYANTPMILKQFLTNFSPAIHRQRMKQIALLPTDLRSHLYLSSDLLIPGRTESELRCAYRNVERFGFLRPRERFQWVVKRTSSLTFVIGLCLRAGFQEIVLCGVDLNRPGTFYEPDSAVRPSTNVHETQDPSVKVLPISVVLRLLDEEVLQDREERVFVGSSDSLLAKWFPVYNWR
jgi:hypothetical protein